MADFDPAIGQQIIATPGSGFSRDNSFRPTTTMGAQRISLKSPRRTPFIARAAAPEFRKAPEGRIEPERASRIELASHMDKP
jgi:hypothetical protein